ncbi:hypothetical protein Zmor_001141 [Zophobas morio]|uniref:Uncharacterized protein n=1 Tax=Zophobas morio TaxID=2755281 RepID=A0AA38J7X4_9CUCU|nr:hypothetical protein Zmor_001141 [Zophobas morio]
MNMSRSFLVDSLINNTPRDLNPRYVPPNFSERPMLPYHQNYISSYLFSLSLAQQHHSSQIFTPHKAPIRPVASHPRIIPPKRELPSPKRLSPILPEKPVSPKTPPQSRDSTPTPEERLTPSSKDMSSKRIRTAFTRHSIVGVGEGVFVEHNRRVKYKKEDLPAASGKALASAKCCCLRTCSSTKKTKVGRNSCDEDIDVTNVDDGHCH